MRLGLELNTIGNELEQENEGLIWVPTTHQCADCLTKDTTMTDARLKYFQAVVRGGKYCFGPDPRSPPDSRGRSVAHEYEEMKRKLAK